MMKAASLPVVGLPVPKQQVSEPVPRRQGEHILLQFDHGPPLESEDRFKCELHLHAEEVDPFPTKTNFAPLPSAIQNRN